ncbi:MAG TPA: sigma-70 family RNA polymerase sigma factor [Bacteroidetes bacterium]|nr:sigma-70 family RNA polymerase sigma factor [Bacteroidota bacterium]
MNDLSDAELIHQFRNGQTQAFNLLVWRWQKPVFNFLYRFLGNLQDAEDVNQKTFIKVYQKISSLKEIDKFRVWLYQVAANEARDQLRKRKRHFFLSLDMQGKSPSENNENITLELPDPGSDDAQQNIYREELKKIFTHAMQEIPQEQREIIIMKIYQDLKFIEIAEILQESLNTVKSRMYYGLKALKKALQKQNFSEEVLHYEV